MSTLPTFPVCTECLGGGINRESLQTRPLATTPRDFYLHRLRAAVKAAKEHCSEEELKVFVIQFVEKE